MYEAQLSPVFLLISELSEWDMIFRMLDQVRYRTLYYKTLQTTKTKLIFR